MRTGGRVVALVGLGAAIATGGMALGQQWVFLGQRQVSDRVDHDVIAVTAERGAFTRIRLTVQRASVDFRRVVIHYANGADEDVELRNTVPAGGETRAIDLKGGDRVIRSVEFWYANMGRGRTAVVRLFGSR